MLQQSFEEAVTQPFPLSHFFLLPAYLTGFFARSYDLIKERRRFGIADRNRFELQEVEIRLRGFVQPRDHRDMLRTRIRHDPDRLPCLDADDVGEELPEMVVIALLQLVLDNNRAPVFVFGNEVDAERASRLLAFNTVELKACSLDDDLRIALQPSGEVERFVGPHLSETHALNAPNPLVPLLVPKIQFAHTLTFRLASLAATVFLPALSHGLARWALAISSNLFQDGALGAVRPKAQVAAHDAPGECIRERTSPWVRQLAYESSSRFAVQGGLTSKTITETFR